jgi:hypothetical protein
MDFNLLSRIVAQGAQKPPKRIRKSIHDILLIFYATYATFLKKVRKTRR